MPTKKIDEIAGRIFAGIEVYVSRALAPVSKDLASLKATAASAERVSELSEQIAALERRLAELEGEKKAAAELRIAS
jgi:ubiquinone biosynthesis protein Coq4